MFQKKKVGNYILIGQLGKGQFGVVYKARAIQDPSQVFAIKQIEKQKVKKSNKLYELFQNEMKIMSQLNHPNIMHLYEFMETQNNYYLVLQYCNNGDLEQYLKKMGKLSEDEAVYFLMQIMNGFKVLHQNNVLHRDVKLANIFLNDDQIVIGDFGFAKQGQGMFFTILGTPITMAPELLSTSKKPYTNKTDLWSIGVCFYQMLFGKAPFNATKLDELIEKQKSQSGNNIDFSSNSNISQDCKDLIVNLIQYHPQKRISWHEFFNHRLFTLHQKKPQNIENMNNSLLYRQNEDRVKQEFMQNVNEHKEDIKGKNNKYQKQFQQINHQKKIEEPQTNVNNYTNNIDQTEKYQQNLQTIRARYVHEKKKIIFIMYTVRKLRNIAKRKDLFYQLSERFMLTACLLLQKGLILNQITLNSLQNNVNSFGLIGFQDFVLSNEKNRFLQNFQEDQKIYDQFQNQMNARFDQEVKNFEFRQEFSQLKNLSPQNLQYLEQVLHRHFLYLRSIVNDLNVNHDEIDKYCLAILHFYLSIFSNQKIPFTDQNGIFEWRIFEKRHDIENARMIVMSI